MYCNYKESFKILSDAKQTALSFLDICIQQVESFNGNYEQLFQQLQKISSSISKEKKSKFNLFKEKYDTFIDEQQFSNIWKHFNDFLLFNYPGTQEIFLYIKSDFLTELQQIRNEYNQKVEEIMQSVQKFQAELEQKSKLTKEADDNYRNLCSQLEELKTNLSSESNTDPNQHQERDKYNALLNLFQAKQTEAIKSLQEYNNQKMHYHAQMERLLTLYEQIEYLKDKRFSMLILTLKEQINEFIQTNLDFTEQISEDIADTQMSSEQNDLDFLQSLPEIAQSIEFQEEKLSYPNIFELIDPKQVFKDDISQRYGIILADTDEYGVHFSENDEVEILSYNVQNEALNVYCENKDLFGLVKKSLVQSTQPRAIFKVTKQHIASNPDELSVEVGEFVTGFPKVYLHDEDNDYIKCINIYRQKGLLPLNKLKPEMD